MGGIHTAARIITEPITVTGITGIMIGPISTAAIMATVATVTGTMGKLMGMEIPGIYTVNNETIRT